MYHIIVNPSSKSGLAKKQWQELKKELNHNKVTYIVHFTTSEKELRRYVKSITDKSLFLHNGSSNRLIILGGDGTLNCVVDSIDDLDHTIVSYLPTGTSNDFARATRIPKDSIGLISSLKKGGVTKQSDIGVVKFGHRQRRFVTSCGFGFDAATCDVVLRSPFKNIFNKLGLGKLIYCAVALKQLLTLEPVSCDLYLDDKKPIHFNRLLFVSFMQLPYEGGGFKLCPEADPSDGFLDICVAHDLTALQALPIFPKALAGKHTNCRGIHMYRAKKVRVVSSKPLCTHTDGEICGHYSQLSLSTHEHVLNYRK